jgi:hypothetical protein
MWNEILAGVLFATAFPSGAASNGHDRAVDPPACSPELKQAIDMMKSRADIVPPVPLLSPEPEFPDSARKQLRKAHSLFADIILGLTVDAEGNPHGVCVIQAAGLGLDGSSANAANRYKFRPATDHGKPIAYPTSMEISFRVY